MTQGQTLTRRWNHGQLVGDRYRIRRFLAEGGAGEVYSARNVWTERRVAVKRLLPMLQSEASLTERFLLEGRIGGKIEHPNIVQVLDMGKEASDGSLFIVQELLRGSLLRTVITEKRRLSVQETMELVIPIVGALVAVHQQGIVHRDIKPENIFVQEAAFGQRIPKLLDFGIAKVHEEHTLTKTGSVMGTLGYMSPEQLQGSKEVDRRADVWSIGIVLYELLAGAHPFDADNYAAAMYKIMHREARDLYDIVPRCPEGISDIVRRTLRKSPQDRPDSMLDLLEELLCWSRRESDESLRSLVSRHRLSIPSTLEQKILSMELQPVSRGVQSYAVPISSSIDSPGPEIDVSMEVEHVAAPSSGALADGASAQADQFDNELSLRPQSHAEAPVEKCCRTLSSAPCPDPAPVAEGKPGYKEVLGDFGSFDFPRWDDDSDAESVRSTGLTNLESLARSATDALAHNLFDTAFDAAGVLAGRAPKDSALRASMRVLQARACFWMGDAAGQEQHAAEAFGLADKGSGLRFQAAAELASARSALGKPDTLLSLVDELAQAEVSDEVKRDYLVGCCRLGIALQRAGQLAHVTRVLGRVQSEVHARSALAPEVRAWVILLGAEVAHHSGDHAHGLTLTHQAAMLFAEHGDSRWACVSRGKAGFTALVLGGHREACSELAEAARQAAASNINHAGMMRLNLGLAEARAGDLPQGLGRLLSCMETLGDSPDRRQRSAAHRYVAEALLALGRNSEAEEHARAAVELAPTPTLQAESLAMLALVLLPRPAEALIAASQAMALLDSIPGIAHHEGRIRLAHAMSLDAMGQHESAREAFGMARHRLLKRAERISDPRWRKSFLEDVRDHQQTLTLAKERHSDGLLS